MASCRVSPSDQNLHDQYRLDRLGYECWPPQRDAAVTVTFVQDERAASSAGSCIEGFVAASAMGVMSGMLELLR